MAGSDACVAPPPTDDNKNGSSGDCWTPPEEDSVASGGANQILEEEEAILEDERDRSTKVEIDAVRFLKGDSPEGGGAGGDCGAPLQQQSKLIAGEWVMDDALKQKIYNCKSKVFMM